MQLTVLIAAHNEEASIGATLDSVLDQTRPADIVVVAADNCTDRTVEIAKGRGVVVFETKDNTQRKAGALNQAWARTHPLTDLYVCIDADTVLPPNALADWEQEFQKDPTLAGCSAKFTMLTPHETRALAESGAVPTAPRDLPPMSLRERTWVRLQKAEFAKWTDISLQRKGQWTSVLAGTACAIRAVALQEVTEWRQSQNVAAQPWSYCSEVEDFELTYRLRSLGWVCRVSATVRAYTGAMLSLRTLWAQRLKWQIGTVRVLRRIGFNRMTAADWRQQALGLLSACLRFAWVALLIAEVAVFHHVHFFRFWWMFPIFFVAVDLRESLRVPHRALADVALAVCLIPQELFAWLRAAWFTWSWVEVVAGRNRDRWALQIAAEGGD
jgi:cellulose synthase/poly-beta-1,6-N-acetylglucosamine synthase-like glycosyltransferase